MQFCVKHLKIFDLKWVQLQYKFQYYIVVFRYKQLSFASFFSLNRLL